MDPRRVKWISELNLLACNHTNHGDAGNVIAIPSCSCALTGACPENVRIAEFKWDNTIIDIAKRAFHGTFHAISKKHFGRYLAELRYRFNRRFSLRQLMSRFTY